ncbi:MAG: uroporphyrinogen decarboxylase family protein [Chloroflexota bacterium]
MHSKQRLLAALRHQPVDRVPANITYYMAAFQRQHFAPQPGRDPFEAHLETQTRFCFDPLVGLGGGADRPWRLNAPGRWEAHQEHATGPHGQVVRYVVETPAGTLDTVYGGEADMSGWQLTPLVKEEGDLAALAYMPDQATNVEAINARWAQLGERGLGRVSINGIWQQACYLRGMEDMAMDPYLRPEWTRAFLGIVADWLARQTEALCRSQAEAFYINESYVGMGLSRSLFDEFVRPYDQRFMDIAKAVGKLVMFHDCGLANALLESFADMGIDYLEPLNPRAASGDVELADVKRRIGARVCLCGGFNHELLSFGSAEEIRREVAFCLETLAPGGGYILCPAGPLDTDVPMANLEAYADAARELCGAYA